MRGGMGGLGVIGGRSSKVLSLEAERSNSIPLSADVIVLL